MCGGRSRKPRTVQAGPSQSDFDAQMRMQQQAQNAIQEQNNALVQQLQQQAQALQAETTKRAEELAAARAPVTTATNANPYNVTTGQGTAGAAQEQTTAPTAPRKPRKPTLQLNAEVSLPGVGINLGGY